MSVRGSVLFSTVVVAVLLSSRVAQAEGGAVVVLGGGAPFREAIDVSLAPWSLRAVGSDGPAPKPQMPSAADDARAIAQRERAAGVVWVATERSEASLWVYDAGTDQLVTRRIGTLPPFDGPTAAAAALTVKTLLRASTVAPPAERLGAGAAPAAPPPPATPPPSGQEPAPEPSDARDAPAPGEPPREAPRLRAEIEGGIRAIARDVDTRGGLALGTWLGERRVVGLGLGASFGPGLSISEDRFRGRFAEVGIAPSARLRLALGKRLALEPRLGVSVHLTSIDGVAVLTTRPASTSRVDASVDAAFVLDVVATPMLTVGIDVGVSAMLRYQRYLVESVSVLELQPVQGFLGLRLTTGLL